MGNVRRWLQVGTAEAELVHSHGNHTIKTVSGNVHVGRGLKVK